MKKISVILASASKRRSEILSSCGIKHKVLVSNTREIHPGVRDIKSALIMNARNKARACIPRLADGEDFVIIGADTLVVLGKNVIGKPKDAAHAKKILKSLSGRKAYVHTGLAIYYSLTKKFASACDVSVIRTAKIPAFDIEKYFSKLGPFDKAGGFSIEGVGSIIFDDITGSYFNILGLPMRRLQKLFKAHGLDMLDLIR